MNNITEKEAHRQSVTLYPVGVISSPIKEPILKAGASDLEMNEHRESIKEHQRAIKKTISTITIMQEYQELLDGIEDFSHALILYWPHLLEPERRTLKKVHPMGRKDLPLTGIFATRSPARPNPVLVSVVRILEREENVLKVMGLEAVEGSPVLDIKPHISAYDSKETPKVSSWMEQIQREMETES